MNKFHAGDIIKSTNIQFQVVNFIDKVDIHVGVYYVDYSELNNPMWADISYIDKHWLLVTDIFRD